MSFLILFSGMVDTGLGKKSFPSWIWHALKPLRYVMMRHANEGLSTLCVDDYVDTHRSCYDSHTG